MVQLISSREHLSNRTTCALGGQNMPQNSSLRLWVQRCELRVTVSQRAGDDNICAVSFVQPAAPVSYTPVETGFAPSSISLVQPEPRQAASLQGSRPVTKRVLERWRRHRAR